MKKTTITTAIIVGTAVVVYSSFIGIAHTIKNNSIGEAKAEQIALTDSDTAVSDARFRKTDFDFEDGKFIYDVEFYTDNGEYEYTIDAKDGDILSRDSDIIKPKENNNSPAPSAVSDTLIDIETAKNTVLTDAGVSDVTFTKEKLERDDGIQVYDIEFLTDDAEYDYEINALTGEIISRDIEKISKNKASTDYISIEQAKETALTDAGVSDVTFTKEKFERDDGLYIYEIEFRTGTTEYEYKILATDGTILECDID